jgi:hypothetical protein
VLSVPDYCRSLGFDEPRADIGRSKRESVSGPFGNREVGSEALLPAGAGRRARAGGKWLAHALLIFVPAMLSGSLMGSGIQPTEVVAAVRNTSVEVLLPEGGRGLQLSCSRGSVVLPVDRVGGPPDLDFTDEGDARLTARRSPYWWRAVLVSVSSCHDGSLVSEGTTWSAWPSRVSTIWEPTSCSAAECRPSM